jgi:hypothetical protein
MKSHSQSRHSHHHMALPLPAPEPSAPSARHGSQITVHQPRIATASLSHHSSLITVQINRQGNKIESQRKSLQPIYSNPNQSLVFVVSFATGKAAAPIPLNRYGSLQSQTREHRQDCVCATNAGNIACLRRAGRCQGERQRATCELDEAAAFRYRSRFC